METAIAEKPDMLVITATDPQAMRPTLERAKAADRVIREHPYQTIGLAFGLGLLIGVLARRR